VFLRFPLLTSNLPTITGADAPLPSGSRHKESLNFRSRISALDGLRGIAILLVFLFHYAGTKGHTPGGAVRFISTVFGFGWTGVDLFFVLSGFLITGILYDTRDDPRYYTNFYARRILRIFPIYYLVVVLFAALAPFLGVHWQPAHLFFLVYLGYPAAILWPALTLVAPLVVTHLWSLAAEEQFYMVWPWTIAKLRAPNKILRACAIMGIAALFFRIAIRAVPGLNPGWAYAFLPGRMDGLAVGAILAILVRSSWRQRVQKWAAPTLILSIIILSAMGSVRSSPSSDDPVIGTIGCSIAVIGYGALLLLSLREGAWPQRALSWLPLRTVGIYSYGFYLYHFPLSVPLSHMKGYFIGWMHSASAGGAVYIIACFAINMMVAAISFHLIESPVMRLKSRFSYARTTNQYSTQSTGRQSVNDHRD
jgi:peptidoglycan/LPS O-acetylase OafA/YrhL